MNNFIIDSIVRLLTTVVDSFKTKNPMVFSVIAVVLLSVYYVLGTLIDYVNPDGTELISGSIEQVVVIIRNVLVALLTLIGAHTPGSMKVPPNTPVTEVEPVVINETAATR